MTGKPAPKLDPNSGPAKPRRRAVAYVRMSTDLQQYSPENQIAVIEHYAAENYMEIVATYSDEARSGLRLENRPGMRQMLADAKREESGFDTILVYDVSRWGRFQNPTRVRRSSTPVRKPTSRSTTAWSSSSTTVAGLRIPVAITRTVWNRLVALPEGYRGFQDESGRLWDVLWMARHYALRASNSDRVRMCVLVRDISKDLRDSNRPPRKHFPVVAIGAGDDGSPDITIMFPEDD